MNSPIAITLSSFKGGVGKTTSSICLATLCSEHGKTLLIDSDPNRSASMWARQGNLPFQTATEITAHKLTSKERFDFLIIDTPARPTEDDLQELIESCHLLIIPVTPDAMSIDALGTMAKKLPKDSNFRILLNMIPPPPQKDGQETYQLLREMGYPVLDRGIRFYKAYKNAAAYGKPIYKVQGGKIAWRDWTELVKTQPLQSLLS
ncbi:MAG: ParA family protein [Oculatellaceae cyanobacterium Prado106]|jgi:chromosome partitioning protein|nr:ParA family protein [Oculatellaceae cyanobacterium Prado106]